MAARITGPQEQVAPPGPARTGPVVDRAARAEFVVLTRSDELLEQVGLALDGAGEVRLAENEEDARQFAAPRNATVMLLDAREQVDPSLVVERLHSSDGTTVIVVFAPADVASDVARAIKGSAAFAVLPIPLEVEKTRAVLLGAGEEAMARRALLAPAATGAPVWTDPGLVLRTHDPAPVPAAPELKPVSARAGTPPEARSPAPPAAGSGTPRASRPSGIAWLVAACLLVAVAGAWFYPREATDPSPQVTAGASGQQPSTSSRDELLDRARVAFHERRYTEPDRENALYYYRSVLAQDPQNAEAREGLERIGAVLEGRLDAALAERHTEEASRTLEQLRSIRPDDAALAAAAAQLAEQRFGAALARGDTDQASALLYEAAATGVPGERLAQLRAQLARLEASRRALQSSRPAGDRTGDEQGRGSPGAGARQAAGQGPKEESAQLNASARATVAPAAVREDVPSEPAVPTAAPGESGPSAADIRRTRYVAPIYPPQALARGQSGEVRVRITVGTDGRVTEVQVLSASPPGVFDQAAVSAVRKWRFEPVMQDGRAIEANVATSIRFQHDDTPRR